MTKKNIRGKARIAVILPIAYRGGTFRGAKILAQAIELGGRQAGQDIEVILAHLDDPVRYPDDEFADLFLFLSFFSIFKAFSFFKSFSRPFWTSSRMSI